MSPKDFSELAKWEIDIGTKVCSYRDLYSYPVSSIAISYLYTTFHLVILVIWVPTVGNEKIIAMYIKDNAR